MTSPEIQIVALCVEEAGLHYSDYELYEVPGAGRWNIIA